VFKSYTTHCDCNLYEENSFGFGCWDYENAKEYCDEKIIKVRINIEDLGACVLSNNNKLRASKITVLEEVEDEKRS